MSTDYPSGDVDQNRPVVESIEDVPVYRRSWFASFLVVFGFFCCIPLLWWVCILCLTGDIYRNKVGRDGRLLRWSRANKVAAILILVVQAGIYYWRLERWIDKARRERDQPPPVIVIEKK
jgi:hypothetical protein